MTTHALYIMQNPTIIEATIAAITVATTATATATVIIIVVSTVTNKSRISLRWLIIWLQMAGWLKIAVVALMRSVSKIAVVKITPVSSMVITLIRTNASIGESRQHILQHVIIHFKNMV